MSNGDLGAAGTAMGREADEFMDELLTRRRVKKEGGVEAAKRSLISYTPTMFIGLGGTGAKTVDKLKGLFLRRKLTDPIFSFLVFDIAEEEKDGLEHIDLSSEFCCMELDDSITYLESNQQLLREWWDPQYRPPRKLTGGGARAVRPNGRLCFFHHALHNVYAHIADSATRIMGRVSGTPIANSEPIVYIIASLCGGTGSGTFLDMAFLTRYAFAQLGKPNVQIVGVFVMNDVYEKLMVPVDWAALKRNTYAALKELEHFMMPSCPEIIRGEAIEYAEDEEEQLVVPYAKPYDLIYLIGSTTENGVNISKTHQMAYLLADGIFLQVASPLGTGTKGAFVFRAAGLLTTMHHDRLCCYSSLGVGALVYPRDDILRYGTYVLLAEQCRLLAGNNIGDVKVRQLAEAFMDKQGIAAEPLRQTLSTTRDGGQYEYAPLPEFQRVINQTSSKHYAEAIEQFEGQVSGQILELKREMAAKATAVVQATVAAARKNINKWFAKGAGLGAACAYLTAITGEDNDDEAAIDRLIATTSAQLSDVNARAADIVDRLSKLRGFIQRLTRSDDLLAEYERVLTDRVALEIDLAILTVCKAFYHSLDRDLTALRDQIDSRLIQPIATLGNHASERRKVSRTALAELDRIHHEYATRTHVKLLVPFAELNAQIESKLTLSAKDAAAGLAEAVPDICEYAAPTQQLVSGVAIGAGARRNVVELLEAQAAQTVKDHDIVPTRRDAQGNELAPGGAVEALLAFVTDEEGNVDEARAQAVIREFYDTVQPQWLYNRAAFNRAAPLGAIGVGKNYSNLIGAGYTPKPLAATTGDLSAIPVLRTDHGVPLSALIGMQVLRNAYDAGLMAMREHAGKGQRRPPLHVFGPACVDWDEPAEVGSRDDKAVRLFALGLAIGEIFPPTPERQGQLRVAWARNAIFARRDRYFIQPHFTRADVEGVRVPRPRLLGHGRYAAFEAFGRDPDAQADIVAYEEEFFELVSPTEWHARLKAYTEGLEEWLNTKVRDTGQRKLEEILELELEQLQAELKRLKQ